MSLHRVCLVTAGPDALGDIGLMRTARTLAGSGCQVVLLCHGQPEAELGGRIAWQQLRAAGASAHRLDDFPLPVECQAPNGTPGCGWGIYASNCVRYALTALHREQRFDAIVFPTRQAIGFRSVQAKRAGVAFHDVRLVVRLDCPSAWLREAEKRWCSPDDLFLDFCEQYTFENADIQDCPSDYLVEQARRLGWAVRPDALALPESTAGPEVVFVGALGPSLAILREAVESLPLSIALSFLVPGLTAADAPRAAEAIDQHAPGRRYALPCGLDRREVLTYLAEEERLAVFCETSETLTPEVRDCAVNGIPFLSARPRWLPGQVADNTEPGPWFFEPSAADLRRRMQALRRTGGSPVSSRAEKETGGPPVLRRATVAVTHYNLGQYLPETLASLAAQTCRALEVLVIDDGSTCAPSRQVWEEQRRLYPQFRFISQDNMGLGAARNRALHEARGEYFIPVDADNIAMPEMVERFLQAIHARPEVSAMTCFFLAFRNTDDIARGKFLHQYCPTGGPHLAGCAFNVYGDANAIFRTSDLRAVGGFETDRSTYCHDWETFVKMVRAGKRIEVVPDYLFYYRCRPDSLSAVMTNRGKDLYPFAQRMLTTFFSDSAPSGVEARLLREALASYFLQSGPQRAEAGLARRTVRRLAAVGRPVWKSAMRLWRSAIR